MILDKNNELNVNVIRPTSKKHKWRNKERTEENFDILKLSSKSVEPIKLKKGI